MGIPYLALILAVLSGAAALVGSLLLRGKGARPPQPSAGAGGRRSSLILVLSGCGALALCLVLALAANAGYWVIVQGVGRDGRGAVQSNPVDGDAIVPGQAASGEQIFHDMGCQACHSLTPGGSGVGPSMAGLGQRAGNARPGYAASAYIYEAIVDPDAHVPPGYQSRIMPAIYRQRLSEQ